MDHVETLALDFTKLKNMGFRHLKVRADTLTKGMGMAQAAVGAEDIKKLLERHGLNLIAERVEDEKTVLQLLDFAVDFAQGYLFGEPRALREDASTRRRRRKLGPGYSFPPGRLVKRRLGSRLTRGRGASNRYAYDRRPHHSGLPRSPATMTR